MEYGPPVDLSFNGLFTVTGNFSLLFSFKELCCINDFVDPRPGLRPLRTDSHNKYRTRALRLNYNNIKDLSDLEFTLNHFLVEPSMLGWLDLSFNKMTGIDDVLCQLNELRILYLHGNNIRYLNEVNKLSKLTHLHNLTLHGNAIDKHKGYRNHVVSVLPHLKRLDFSAVTKQERVLAKDWSTSHSRFYFIS
uniref:Leucine-rich repeat-containing protein 51 n=1 Tax=Cyprinodon variegatus TaxID=28743 RepID=A0A3Q2CFC4_CYPVA